MNKFDKFYMTVARSAAQLSYANRLKVGAVAVRDTNILAYGYNGTLPGESNMCEGVNPDGSTYTLDTVLHAEENLLIKMAVSHQSLDGATVFLTHQPCIKCSRMLAAAKVARIVFENTYRDPAGLILLLKRNIVVDKFSEESIINVTATKV